MSLLKADQVRRELFVTYSQQIAELLGEMEEKEEEKPQEEPTPPVEVKENIRNLGMLLEAQAQEEEKEEEEEEQQEEEKEIKEELQTTTEFPKRFRISYARQHLLRQRALRLPEASSHQADGGHLVSSPRAETEGVVEEEDEENNNMKAIETITTTTTTTTRTTVAVKEEEEEGWRLAYNEPFPSLRKMMRRVQDESLSILVREARVPPAAYRDDDYTRQRMTVLRELEEQIGRDRIKLLARLQKMDGKLHLLE
ncbi:uncharacterized protein TM35_000132700 [Trypanosoma theileri]|uniref:Uncharacterized protein n=1 Tax=Trypanosoma theileri TaxID=67003 RepID=A0A1X0NX33_9TRYP|nr:uncharacterized protein TM35_000132700 [Trypanosoma theileri]ORC89266.1 hypothetical protein TM35_000132700 [Trypanosoma theileri]